MFSFLRSPYFPSTMFDKPAIAGYFSLSKKSEKIGRYLVIDAAKFCWQTLLFN